MSFLGLKWLHSPALGHYINIKDDTTFNYKNKKYIVIDTDYTTIKVGCKIEVKRLLLIQPKERGLDYKYQYFIVRPERIFNWVDNKLI